MQIIIPHSNTDLDALGAAVGAQVLYPQAAIVLPGNPSPQAGEFISLHRYNLRVRTARDVDLSAVTRAIVVDTADPARLGPMRDLVGRAEVHLFDHHPPESDDLKAAVEVRDLVGSACTLIAELIEEAGAAVNPLQATAMLLGIYADTGSLSLTGTTDRDARAAAFLLSKGANLRAMARFIQATLSPTQHDLLQQLQSRARWINARGARIRLLEGETPEYVGGLAMVVHRLQEIMPAPAFFAVVKMADRVHLVARSDVPWVNGAAVMSLFGGGGHPAAASAVVKGATTQEIVGRLEQELPRLVEQPLMAHDVMTSPVKAITPDKPCREAERLMLRYGHSGLPVVDEIGQLQGVVSLRDVEKARRHGLEHAPVKGVMMRRVVTVGPEMPVDQVQELMVEKDIGRVPVVAENNLVGIISRSDLLGLLYDGPAPRWHSTLYASGDRLSPDLDDVTARLQESCLALPEGIRQLLVRAGRAAEQIGMPVFAVGGFVRDLLLGQANLDVDIVAEGDGMRYARALAGALGGRVNEVPRFASAHVYLHNPGPGMPKRIDVATARREYYEHAAALPLVEHADLREDLYRRDFSINAMAVRLGPDGPLGLVDFFGGMKDLQDGMIRILHSLSFVEDPTRILRAVRFAHRYGFQLEAETGRLAALAIREGYLRRVSAERQRNELILILQESRSCGALAQLQELGALAQMLPGVLLDDAACMRLDRVEQLELEIPDLYLAATPWLVKLLCVLHMAPLASSAPLVSRMRLRREHAQPLQHTLTTWKVALDTITQPNATPGEAVRVLAGHSPEGLLLLYLVGGGEMVARYWREWRHVRLEITGADVIRAGVPAGPAVGAALARVLADRLDGVAPDQASQMARALRYASEEA